MRKFIFLAAALLCACGSDEAVENPTNCSVQEVADGTNFTCTDKNGVESSGTVKRGENGAAGQGGPKGDAGAPGRGLSLATQTKCSGSIEGWMEKSRYDVVLIASEFETGDKFLSSTTKLVRGDETINERQASSFYLAGAPKLVVNDGLFRMELADGAVVVTSEGGVKASIACVEVK